VATRRSKFAAILKNEGVEGLIGALNRKAEMLIGSELANVSGAPTRVELNQ
jgi:hypothetical protein